MLLCIYTVARIGELINLQWSDIDLGRAILKLRTRKTADGSEKVREVPIHPVLLTELQLVQNKTGRVLRVPSYWEARRRLVMLFERAGVEYRQGFHIFRHTAISTMLERTKGDLASIREITGQTIQAITRYSHGNLAGKGNAILGLDKVGQHDLIQE